MYKVGDYIQYEYSWRNEYIVGKIKKIKDGVIFFYWSDDYKIKKRFNSKKECDKIIKYNKPVVTLTILNCKNRIEKLKFNLNKRIN